jgi:membrane protease YdiL (CAAX protease family)
MRHTAKGLLAFLLLSFGLAWGSVLVVRVVADMSLVNPLAQLPMAFSPAVAAVVVRRWVTREGFHDAGLRLRVRGAGRYYLAAWVGPVLVVAAAVGLAAALGLYRPDVALLRRILPGADLAAPVALALVLAAPVLALPLFWGEEFGWRGYLQRRVSPHPVKAALVTGTIWAVWHYPLVLTDYLGGPNPLLELGTWTLLTVAQAVILAWLFLASGSVWVPCLAHAGNNLVIGSFSDSLLGDGAGLDPATVDLLHLVPLAAICAWILLTGRLRPVTADGADAPAAEAVGRTRAA